jgi:hypothetical protein
MILLEWAATALLPYYVFLCVCVGVTAWMRGRPLVTWCLIAVAMTPVMALLAMIVVSLPVSDEDEQKRREQEADFRQLLAKTNR